MVETIQKPVRALTPAQQRFVTLICEGKSKAMAYRIAFDKPRSSNQLCAQRGCEVAKRAAVAARLAELAGDARRGQLLSLEDRKAYLSGIARSPKEKTADRTRAIEVYTKIAGDGAPDKHVLAGMEGGVPIKTETVAKVEIAIEPTVEEKARFLMQRLEGRRAGDWPTDRPQGGPGRVAVPADPASPRPPVDPSDPPGHRPDAPAPAPAEPDRPIDPAPEPPIP